MTSRDEKVTAFQRVISHLEYNQAYHDIAWTEVNLLEVSDRAKRRYRALVKTINDNLDVLRGMYSSGSYDGFELEVIVRCAAHHKTMLQSVEANLETIERLRKQSPLF